MSLKNVIQEWKGQSMQELLIEMYVKKNMTMTQISNELHVSIGIVHKWLKEYEIQKEIKF